MNITFIA